MTGPHARDRFGGDRISRLWDTLRRNWFPYALITPILVYLAILVWYPFFRSVVMSFYFWPMFGDHHFVGLRNYVNLFTSTRFREAVVATAMYGLQIPIQLVLGTIMALIVNHTKHFKTVLGALFLLPYIIPPAVTAALTRFLLHPDVGLFFRILVDAGILDQPIYWMSYGRSARFVITMVGVWTWTPLVFLLVYAGLQTVPEVHYEIARVYGASRWQRFRKITYPHIKSILLIAFILRVIWNLGKVTQPLLITRGEPAGATTVLGILVYQLGVGTNLGSSFATGVVIGVISFICILGFLYEFERTERKMQD